MKNVCYNEKKHKEALMEIGNEYFNKLLLIITYDKPNISYKKTKHFTYDNKVIYYNFNDYAELDEILYHLFISIDKRNIFSNEFLQKQLNLYLIDNNANGKNSTFKSFQTYLKTFAAHKYFIYAGLYGANIQTKTSLGKYLIVPKNELFKLVKGYDTLLNGIALTDEQINVFAFEEADANTYIGIEIESFDDKHACDIARMELLNFEKLMCFGCLRNGNRPPIRIFNLVNSSTSFLILEKDNWSRSSSLNPLFVGTANYTIETLIKEMEDNQSKFIFDLYSKQNRNDLESRIINTILWMGQANIEENSSVKLLEYCFALESLLQIRQGETISPSITYQISRACAIIIGTNYADRNKIVENLQSIYRLRSAIAHGGSKTIDAYYNDLIWQYLIKLVYQLTYSQDWNYLKSAQELWNKVESIMLLG